MSEVKVKKTSISLPERIWEGLQLLAKRNTKRPLTLAADLVEEGVMEAIRKGEIPDPAEINNVEQPIKTSHLSSEFLTVLAQGGNPGSQTISKLAEELGIDDNVLINIKNAYLIWKKNYRASRATELENSHYFHSQIM